MVLLIFAYGGFEAALISAGEAKNPRRDMPFGLFAALLTCAVIYGLIQWVVVGVLPDPGHSERPLADVARIVMGAGGASLIAVGALFSIYGYLSGNMLATPRITFALAERGDFPSLFAAVHPPLPHAVYFHLCVRRAGAGCSPGLAPLRGTQPCRRDRACFTTEWSALRSRFCGESNQDAAAFHLPGGHSDRSRRSSDLRGVADAHRIQQVARSSGRDVAVAFLNWLVSKNSRTAHPS